MGLRAQVRTPEGWAVQHAAVTLTDRTGRQVARADVDADGAVSAEVALVPGPYTVIVTAAGYAPAASTAFVTGGGVADAGTVVLTRQAGAELPPPGVWTIDPAHSSVATIAQHLGISSVRGRFTEFGGRIEVAADPERSRVDAIIAASSIDTVNDTRDKHLRSPDFLDVERFPEITYRSTGVVRSGPDRWTVRGELALHGVVREVALDLSYLGTGPDPWGGVRTAFRATTELRRDDFAMYYNQVVRAGMTAIGTTLRVELDIQAVREVAPPAPDQS
ncbi:YceI family protein [Streptomyces sp. NBC_01498]|uniref:YceI family protein n=1 Tax=Streptomyces sp. NBC_01498 TaxID=2975870 RepID=UPI002E7C1041|nr:YceI family protein [Streptomyces sp. NBC_01498]WTL25980.1 YceI family protein [Streptomyces sp. NBC_01498]